MNASTAATAPSGIEHRAREQQPPVDDREHEPAGGQPEQAAPRERRELDDEQEAEQVASGTRSLWPGSSRR